MKTVIISLFLFFLIVPNKVAAGPISIKAKLDSASLLMGKQTGLHIEIVQDKGASGYIPLAEGDTITQNVEIIGWKQSDTTDLGNNRIQIDKTLILQSFDSGLYTLPPVLYVSGKDTFQTNRLSLKVIPVSIDSLANIHDYKTVADPNTKWTDYLPDFITDYWWLYLIVLALVGCGVYVYIRWKQGKSLALPLLPKKKLLPPYEEAIAAMSELKAAGLWQRGQDKEYYTRLTEIIRHYIDRRFNINAMEQTSTQILEMLEQEDAAVAKAELKSILEIADFVKFAKMKPLANENEEAYQFAIAFLEKTKPQEVEKEDSSEAEGTNEPQKMKGE